MKSFKHRLVYIGLGIAICFSQKEQGGSFISPPSFVQSKNLNDVSLKQIILLRYFLMQYSRALLENENWSIRAAAAENLGKVTRILAHKGGIEPIKEQALSLYQKALRDSDDIVLQKVGESFGDLAEAVAEVGQAQDLTTAVLPLYENALKTPNIFLRRGVASRFSGLIKAWTQKKGVPSMKKQILPLYEKVLLKDTDWGVRANAAKNLGELAEVLFQKEGIVAVREIAFPIYKNLLNDLEESVVQSGNNTFYPWLQRLVKEGILDFTAAQQLFFPYLMDLSRNIFSSKQTVISESIKAIDLVYDPALTDPKHPNHIQAIIKAIELISSFPPFIFTEPIDSCLLTEEFLSRESLKADKMSILLLGMSLVNPGEVDPFLDPTTAWKKVILILSRLKKMSQEPGEYSYFSLLLQEALQRNNVKMVSQQIEQAYKEYFLQKELPKRKDGPKDLIGLILLDFELSRWNLPQKYVEEIQRLRRGPSYIELLSIVSELGLKDSFFRETLLGFSQWSETISEREKGPYWGNVQQILEITARGRYAFETLGLWEEVKAKLRIYEGKSRNKIKLLQQTVAEMEKLFPEKMDQIFHFESKGKNIIFDEKEVNVISYVAKHFPELGQPVNEALRSYFQARCEGKSKEEAIDIYHQNLKNLPEVKKLLNKVPPSFLDKKGASIKKIEPLSGFVFLENVTLKQKANVHLKGKSQLSGSLTQHEALPFVREVSIYIERDPIEIAHLGWPRLGKSCLDLLLGPCEKEAGGYLLNPLTSIVYIRDKKKPRKPLAEISVAVDSHGKTLYLLSPIKTNTPYECRPLVEKFIKKWAAALEVTPFFPKQLYPEGLFSFPSSDVEKRRLRLSKGAAHFFSDLTCSFSDEWQEDVCGWKIVEQAL